MSYRTLEVELDHGRVVPVGAAKLPEHGRALLTLLPESKPGSQSSLADSKPASVGKLLKPYPDPEDDVLAELTSEPE